MFRELWDAFCEWAAEAWNWLKNFFSKVWETIVSWWDALRDTIEGWLKDDDDEVDVLNLDTKLGRDIYKAIQDNQPNVRSVSKYQKRVVLHFDSSNGNLKEVANFETNKVQHEDEFERDLRASNGILRIKE